MPVYAMSCFKLSQGIVSEIESLLMNFWWEKSSNQRGIPWIAWKRLQYSKKEGGLGFRDLAKFNDALLAKQAWRLIQHPDSLFARVMKARYYREDSILEAKARKQQSYEWASILSGIALLKKGTKYTIGDGKTIRLGIDNVVDSYPPRPLHTSERYKGAYLDTLFRFNDTYTFWDDSKILQYVNPSDHDFIQRCYLSTTQKPNTLTWGYNFTGDYMVRSGYWLLTHDPLTTTPPVDRPHGSTELKNKIWKLPIMPKLKHFIWRALAKALATKERFTKRGMRINPTCPRCHRTNESINHALFTCPFAIMAWRLADNTLFQRLQVSDNFENNISNSLDFIQGTNVTDLQKLLPFWLLWRIWKAGNNVVFNNFRESPTNTALRAQAETRDWLNATYNHRRVNPQTRSTMVHNTKWKALSDTHIKCNYDAGFNVQNLDSTAGWIIRNHDGIAQHWGSLQLDNTSTPLEAETKALLAALKQTWIRGYRRMIKEGVCETLTNLVT